MSVRRVTIRPARRSEVATLAALEQRSFATDRLSARQYRRHVGSPSAVVLVAEGPGGAVLGSAVVFLRAASRVARLYSIAVDAAARGRGIGAALLDASEAVARRRARAVLRLEVRQDNPAAIALYEARGYRRTGARTAYYEDGADAWRYERALARARTRK